MTDRSTTTDDTPTTGQKFAAEVLGTFVLVFFGVGAALMSGGDYITTGLTFGLTVVVMAYAVGRISGGHFNPAVTLGAVLGGRLPWSSLPLYVGAQLVGGLVAGAALFGLMHGFEGYSSEGGIGANAFGAESASNYAMWAAFALEALLTLVFLFVILAVTDERNEFQALMGPLAIGFALAMIHFASMGATGTSVNPARSIGVGVFGGTDAIIQLWLFIVAPLVGAAIAGLTYPLVFGQASEPVAGSGLSFGGGRKQQASYAPPATYEQQWNQGPPPPWQAPAAPPQQPWGQPAPDPYAAPPAQQQPPAQPWGQPPTQPAPPARPPAQPPAQQWGQPAVDPYAPPAQQPPAQQWGQPIEDDGEDGRTQVRRPD
jgi:aquaporin Z